MEEKSKKAKNSYKRTSHEQLEAYVKYIDEHPEIKTNKMDPTNPYRISKLWDELASKLNSLRGPTRTPSEWQKTLSYWKNQLRSRARKNKASKLVTGGGLSMDLELNTFEDRALEAFGSVVVEGDREIPTLGLQTNDSNPLDFSGVSQSTSYSTETASPSKKPKKNFEVAKEMIERKIEKDEKFQQQFLETQVNLADALKAVGEGMSSFAKVMEKLVK